jgi:hypothetical protein
MLLSGSPLPAPMMQVALQNCSKNRTAMSGRNPSRSLFTAVCLSKSGTP